MPGAIESYDRLPSVFLSLGKETSSEALMLRKENISRYCQLNEIFQWVGRKTIGQRPILEKSCLGIGPFTAILPNANMHTVLLDLQ